MDGYLINIVPFNYIRNNVEVAFSTNEKENYSRIIKRNIPEIILNRIPKTDTDYIWWSFSQKDDDIVGSVNLIEGQFFAKQYINKKIFMHFFEKGLLTNRNFITDTEVYCEENSLTSNMDYERYRVFTLRVDRNDFIDGLSLLVSYDGDSFIHKMSVETLGLSNNVLGKVKYKGRISKFKDLNEFEQSERNNIFPVLNRDIRFILKIPFVSNFSENKYKKYYDQINSFYLQFLKGQTISDCINILESGFIKPNNNKIFRTDDNSNLLVFGNNKTHFVPYIGIKENGPIQRCPEKPVKIFFIFHEEDKEYANKVYSFLKKGYKSFPGLQSFVRIQFDIDTSRSIRYKSSNPINEIESSLLEHQNNTSTMFLPENTYAAIYISRIKKNGDDEEIDNVYYRLKELLLKYNVISQVIFKENIDNPSFNYFLPNIAIALLAKLGGIPWRLFRPIKNDLVVGIGADRTNNLDKHYIGNAFCFKNDGRFVGFNVFEKSDTLSLAKSIKESLEYYIKENKDVERLVIHYYKKMSKAEEKPIYETLNRMNLKLPYIVLTINETVSKDYVFFDTFYDGRMPQSGTFIKTKWNEFILCNNTRYSNNTGTKIESFPLPIKIKVNTSNYEKGEDLAVIRELIDQVYQFSRMYWKSVRQRNLPVTIEYSELIAKMVSHFENKELKPFARNTLWFL
jgi:hypothetical protein